MRGTCRHLLWASLLLGAPPAFAQTANEADAPSEADTDIMTVPVAGPPASIWVAGLHAGYIDREGVPESPYATLSVTRFRKQAYLRAGLTAYRSSLRQVDAALPSTYYIGSLGAGGNFDDWVIDAHVSYGRQAYGAVETGLGKRASAFSSTGYFATGFRAGRVFRPAPRFYVTPTLGVDYVDTKSLRHGINAGRPIDFEVAERALTGIASLRIDRTFGPDEQSYAGLSLSHHESDNGLTSTLPLPTGAFTALRTPDSWQQLEASGTLHLRPKLWLDGQLGRTFGATAGNSTTVTLGLRLQL